MRAWARTKLCCKCFAALMGLQSNVALMGLQSNAALMGLQSNVALMGLQSNAALMGLQSVLKQSNAMRACAS